jgi:hypothetical protein
MRYNDQHYIDEFLATGKLPDIHKDFRSVIENFASEPEPALDLGCSIGMIMIALSQARQGAPVIGIEPNQKDWGKCSHVLSQMPKRDQEFHLYHYEIGYDWETLRNILDQHKPTLVTARRVLPEISETGLHNINKLAGLLCLKGVKKLIIEGRIPTTNPSSKLPTLVKELVELEPYFIEKHRYKNVSYLVVNEGL